VIRVFRSFLALERSERRLAVEAMALLVFVWLALRLLPFLTLRGLLSGYAARLHRSSRAASVEPERIARVVRAVADRAPFSITCLVRALVSDAMLRRSGFDSQLRIGVRLGGSRVTRSLEAHAWVECEDRIVGGELENLDDYAVLSAPGRS
jgi:hypothetical protein